MSAAGNNYVVISPVKDEAKHIDRTLSSIVGQTVRPLLWIIVDDGSQDGTARLVERYAKEHSWIRLLRIERDGPRELGSAEIRAFDYGYQLAREIQSDFIVKLDGDLELPSDYFERLITKFRQDDQLGIASGIYLEEHRGHWKSVKLPPYHASGASKMVRAKCFSEIGGFILFAGWDTVDEIRAQLLGWKTCHFQDIQFYHLRKEGSASGSLSTNLLHGEVFYVTGGGILFLLLKVLHRMLSDKPFLFGGLAMLWGFLWPWINGKARLVTGAEARSYQQLLDARIWNQLARFAGCLKIKPAARGAN